MRVRASSLTFALVPAFACGVAVDAGEQVLSHAQEQTAQLPVESDSRMIDVLFVIDDSVSMAGEPS